MIPGRYLHNLSVYSEKDYSIIRKSRITIVGAGGLGGYIIEQFARLGVGSLRIIDNDVFETSNLNRQIYSDTDRVGKSKAETAGERVNQINPDVEVSIIIQRLVDSNAGDFLEGSDLVIDAVDNIKTKLLIQDTCMKTGKAFIHGAVGARSGQVSLVLPGQNTLDDIYNRNDPDSIMPSSIPPFTPAVAASIQVSEGLKYLLNQHNPKERILYYFNLESPQILKVDMGEKEK